MPLIKLTRLLAVICFAAIFFAGCKPVEQNITYFKNVPDSLPIPVDVDLPKFKDPVIRTNDMLQISIVTLDKDDNILLKNNNTIPVGVSSSGAAGGAPAILVDNKGMIELPAAGKIYVAGLTTFAARDTIRNRLEKFYKQPVVSVNFANFTINVLGEINRPGPYIIANEKVSILDAISMAGDLSIDGKRENIMLIRDSAGVKTFARFNINNTNFLSSYYYYLRQGDIVYVEPKKSKQSGADAIRGRNVGYISLAFSILITIVSLIVIR